MIARGWLYRTCFSAPFATLLFFRPKHFTCRNWYHLLSRPGHRLTVLPSNRNKQVSEEHIFVISFFFQLWRNKPGRAKIASEDVRCGTRMLHGFSLTPEISSSSFFFFLAIFQIHECTPPLGWQSSGSPQSWRERQKTVIYGIVISIHMGSGRHGEYKNSCKVQTYPPRRSGHDRDNRRQVHF